MVPLCGVLIYGVKNEKKRVAGMKKILKFSLFPKGRKEIMILLGIGMHPQNYYRHITPLLKAGFLVMTLPEKPNNRYQKYVTTKKGKRFLKGS